MKRDDSPDVQYVIEADNLVQILKKYGLNDKDVLCNIFTDLKPYEDDSILKEIVPGRSKNKKDAKQETIDALFCLSDGTYKYFKIKLAPSSIKKAGTGVFAVENIPKGAKAPYKGILKRERHINPYYSWTIKSYDEETGEQDDEDTPLYYLDAFDIKTSNWTRFVNCGMKNKDNNFN